MAEGLNIGKLSGRIELEDKVTNVLDILESRLEKFDHSFGGFGSRIAEQAASFFSAEAAMEAVKFAAEKVADVLKEITIEGASIADVEKNFDRLTETSGRLGSTLIQSLQKGTHDTVTEFQLMKLASADLAAGMNLTDEQFSILSKGAFALAQATGVDVKQALDTMNDAMLTGRVRSLQMLTGKIDLADAEDRFAARLGVTADRLTAEGKIEAARAAILERVGEVTARLGDQTDGLDERVAQLQVGWQNFMEDLGKTIATSPVLMAALDGIQGALSEAFGPERQDLIKRVAGYVDDVAIGTMNLAEVVVDAVGVIGVEWNAALVVFDSVKAGWAAIFYVVEEGVAMAMSAIETVTLGAVNFGDAVDNLRQRGEDWYTTMSETQAAIESHKKAEDEWAISTGKVKDQIEAIKQRMVDAKNATKEGAEETEHLTGAHEKAGAAADKHGEAEKKTGLVMELTKEQVKAYMEAWENLNQVGSKWQETLLTVEPEQQKTIKYYLDAGVAVDTLAKAFPNLTKSQIEAVQQSVKFAEIQVQNVKMISDAWTDYYQRVAALGNSDLENAKAQALQKYQAMVDKLQETGDTETSHYEELWKLYEKDVKFAEQADLQKDASTKAHLLASLDAAIEKYQFMMQHSDQYTAKDIANQREIVASLREMRDTWGEVGTSIDKDTEKVRSLSGEVLTLKEYEARQLSGGSFTYDLTSQKGLDQYKQLNTAATFSMSDQSIIDLAKKGWTLEQLIKAGYINPYGRFGNTGNLPQFSEGGVGDFGSGTQAMLHGKEAIIPLEHAGLGLGGSLNLTFNVNGTAVQAAQQIKDIIIRELKSVRQFPSA
jgi:uncharacterized protein (DUF433 family)